MTLHLYYHINKNVWLAIIACMFSLLFNANGNLNGLVYFKRHSVQLFLVFRSEYTVCTCSCTVGKKQVLFSVATGNWELMQECFPKHAWELHD